MQYYHVSISAENTEQANTILDALLEKKLVFGGPIRCSKDKFWWKGEVIEQDYCFIHSYTREDLKDRVIEEAENASVEEICMISFLPFEGNEALIKLLDDTFDK